MAKVSVLARTIHMETVHVRGDRIDFPGEQARVYVSTEFIHRLSGYIMSIAYGSTPSGADAERMIQTLIKNVEPRGQYFVDQLRTWIGEARSNS